MPLFTITHSKNSFIQTAEFQIAYSHRVLAIIRSRSSIFSFISLNIFVLLLFSILLFSYIHYYLTLFLVMCEDEMKTAKSVKEPHLHLQWPLRAPLLQLPPSSL